MPKLKTNKSVAKRFKKKGDRLFKRTCGLNHFNSRLSGKQRRNKRSETPISDIDAKNLQKFIPYK
jgi:large subunit ribosomal protein L35